MLSQLIICEEDPVHRHYKILFTAIIVAIFFAAGFAGCTSNTIHKGDTTAMHGETIEKALIDLNQKVLSLPDVVGTAQGLCDGKPCLKVYIKKFSPELRRQIPTMIDGYSVIAEETGEIRTLPENRNQ